MGPSKIFRHNSLIDYSYTDQRLREDSNPCPCGFIRLATEVNTDVDTLAIAEDRVLETQSFLQDPSVFKAASVPNGFVFHSSRF